MDDPARAQQIADALSRDTRVEAAEPEMTLSLPPASVFADPDGEALLSDHIERFARSEWASEFHRIEHDAEANGTDGWLHGTRTLPQARTITPPSVKDTKPNDPRYDEQWNFQMVHAERAWERTRGKGAIVAVIDTGVCAKTTKKGNRAKDFNLTKFTKGYDFVNLSLIHI